jgi:hypothetical protein
LDNSTSTRSSGNKIVDDTRCTPVYFWQAFAFASGVGGDGFAISPKRMANGCPKIKNGRVSTKPIISEMFTKKFKVKNLQEPTTAEEDFVKHVELTAKEIKKNGK